MLESTGKHVDRINILTTTDGNIGVSSMIACEFVIGVTGHRDPVASDIIELKKNIVHAIGQVRHSFEDLPVRLVTGMAEGADTLAAEVALDMGLLVTAVLPMPRAFYEQDFQGAALARLNELLDDPRMDVYEIPLVDRVEET